MHLSPRSCALRARHSGQVTLWTHALSSVYYNNSNQRAQKKDVFHFHFCFFVCSPKYAAGQQCCYDKTGAQVLTSDSIGGSTPDRGHDWGSPPYKTPPKVPSFSHWKYDVITFYYCCLWSDNCEYYFTHRPSSDCRTYQPPKAGEENAFILYDLIHILPVSFFFFSPRGSVCVTWFSNFFFLSASVLGDPHFITFDGSTYTFNGKGEYVLLHSPEYQLTVQGRTEPMKSENGKMTENHLFLSPCKNLSVTLCLWQKQRVHFFEFVTSVSLQGSVVMATRLSSVAMKENNSDVIEVRLADKPDHLQVLQNRQVLSFSEQTWMDLEGETWGTFYHKYWSQISFGLSRPTRHQIMRWRTDDLEPAMCMTLLIV